MAANGFMNETAMQKRHRSKYENPRPKSQIQMVKDFLKRELEAGPVHKKDLEDRARAEGVKASYFADAKAQIEIVSEKSVERPGQVLWSLPEPKPTAAVNTEATVDPNRTHHLCEDEFSVTVDERRKYGIRDNEQVCWIRDNKVWKGHEIGDSVRKWMRDNPGGRVVMHEGDTVGNGFDVIMAVRPLEEVEKLRAREQEAATRESRHLTEGYDDDFDRTDQERLKARMRRNSKVNVEGGLIGPGSPSSGMAYEEYVRNRGLTRQQIEAEEMRYSLGNRAGREYSQEEYEQTIAENRRAGGRGRDAGNGGKFISIPANVRPRNLAAK